MNTFLSRLNALFAFSLSVTASLTFACFLTTHFLDYGQDVNIEIEKIAIKNVEEYPVGERHDLGHFYFNLEANMTPVFNWNCKELFLYLIAEYETPKNKLNQVVLWDKIINRGEASMLDLKRSSNKYYFFDDGQFLRGKDVKLSLHWNIIPNAGYLWRVAGRGNVSVTMPEEYTSLRPRK